MKSFLHSLSGCSFMAVAGTRTKEHAYIAITLCRCYNFTSSGGKEKCILLWGAGCLPLLALYAENKKKREKCIFFMKLSTLWFFRLFKHLCAVSSPFLLPLQLHLAILVLLYAIRRANNNKKKIKLSDRLNLLEIERSFIKEKLKRQKNIRPSSQSPLLGHHTLTISTTQNRLFFLFKFIFNLKIFSLSFIFYGKRKHFKEITLLLQNHKVFTFYSRFALKRSQFR